MKNGIMALALAALVAPAFAGDAKDEAALRQAVQDTVAAFNRSDAKAVAMAFAEDGDHVAPDGRMSSGRMELEKNLAGDFNGPFKGTKSEAMVNSIKFIKPDVAMVNVTHSVSGMKSPDGKDMPTMKFMVSAAAVKGGGKWWWSSVRVMMPMPKPEMGSAAPAAPATPATPAK